MISPMKFFSRSHAVKDESCQRARFWNYEADGRGYSSDSTSLALYNGTTIHDALAAIHTLHMNGLPVDIDEIAGDAARQTKLGVFEASEGEMGALEFANEQAALIEGLVRGYYKHSWPRLLAAYPTVIAVEEEMELTLGEDLTFMSKPDLLMEDPDGELVYVEFKSTSSKKTEWINSWDTAVQVHSTIRAVEQTLGRAPQRAVIVGLYKGYVSYGKQNSPFCYVYKKNGNPPFTQDQFSYEFKAGFKKYAAWELPGGVKTHVESMPDTILVEQFPQTPEIFINTDLVDRWFAQREIRERNIITGNDLLTGVEDEAERVKIMDEFFPQTFSACSPAWGFGCSYKSLCFGNSEANPLEMGFKPRESHHRQEAEQHTLLNVDVSEVN